MTITKAILYRPDVPGTYKEIPAGTICENARFVFDRPVTVLEKHLIAMRDGQFWLISGSHQWFLSGKWVNVG